MFGLQFGILFLEKEIVVVDIQDEMLFGVDILQNLGEEKVLSCRLNIFFLWI